MSSDKPFYIRGYPMLYEFLQTRYQPNDPIQDECTV